MWIDAARRRRGHVRGRTTRWGRQGHRHGRPVRGRPRNCRPAGGSPNGGRLRRLRGDQARRPSPDRSRQPDRPGDHGCDRGRPARSGSQRRHRRRPGRARPRVQRDRRDRGGDAPGAVGRSTSPLGRDALDRGAGPEPWLRPADPRQGRRDPKGPAPLRRLPMGGARPFRPSLESLSATAPPPDQREHLEPDRRQRGGPAAADRSRGNRPVTDDPGTALPRRPPRLRPDPEMGPPHGSSADPDRARRRHAPGIIAGTLNHFSRPFPADRGPGRQCPADGDPRRWRVRRRLARARAGSAATQYPCFPAPGLFWLWEIAIGTNPKIARPSNIRQHRPAASNGSDAAPGSSTAASARAGARPRRSGPANDGSSTATSTST